MRDPVCRVCGGPVERAWRMSQALPNNPMCEACWETSHWGPAGAVWEAGPSPSVVAEQPLVLIFTEPDRTYRRTAGTVWREGDRIAYATPSWRHGLTVRDREDGGFDVVDEKHPPGTVLRIEPDPGGWVGITEPDGDLLDLLRPSPGS